MRITRRTAGALLTMTLLAAFMTVPTYAATRKKISSVNVAVEADIKPYTRFGEEEIEITVRGGKCSYDTYEIENVGFEWQEDDVPQITIYLNADENYYFSLTRASAVKLTGATYVKAAKENSSETLKLTVQLPSLQEAVGEMGDVSFDTSGYAAWDAVQGAGSYELRLYRNGTAMGVTLMTTNDTFYNFKDKITREGSYMVMVRPVNKINQENKGDWVESPAVNLSKEQVAAIQEGTAGSMPTRGEWKQDGTGSWYEHTDGSYTKNGWEDVKGEWYFFDENGYCKMDTWVEWEGKRYYCGPSGAMLRNTTTPDGYAVGADGTPKTD